MHLGLQGLKRKGKRKSSWLTLIYASKPLHWSSRLSSMKEKYISMMTKMIKESGLPQFFAS